MPRWPEIYVTDDYRWHSLAKAMSDYPRVERADRAAGYDPIMPRDTVEARADLIVAARA